MLITMLFGSNAKNRLVTIWFVTRIKNLGVLDSTLDILRSATIFRITNFVLISKSSSSQEFSPQQAIKSEFPVSGKMILDFTRNLKLQRSLMMHAF